MRQKWFQLTRRRCTTTSTLTITALCCLRGCWLRTSASAPPFIGPIRGLRLARSVRILGISAYYRDSAAALLADGEIVAAASEQRFTRKKGDAGFPARTVENCLGEAARRSRASSAIACSRP